MKKIFSAVLGTAMMLGMVACNGGTSKTLILQTTA